MNTRSALARWLESARVTSIDVEADETTLSVRLAIAGARVGLSRRR